MPVTVRETPALTSPDVRAPARRAALWTFAVGAVLAMFTLAFERIYLPLPYPSDQINYFDAARDFPHPNPGTPVHQFTRFGLTLPLRAAIEMFGYSQAAYYLVPILTGLALVLAVYLLGTLLFARSVGVAAAALTLANNLIFFDVLQPLPDVLATAVFCWAVVLAVAVHQCRPLVSSSRRRRLVTLLVIGALLGWSYLTREYVVFAWPLVGVLIFRRVGWRGLGLVAVPLALAGITDLALSALTYGDPFARLLAITGHGSGPVPADLAATFQDMPRGWYLSRFITGLRSVPEGEWLLAALAGTVVGGLAGWLSGGRRHVGWRQMAWRPVAWRPVAWRPVAWRPVAWRRIGLLLGWVALVYIPLVLLGGVLDPSAPKLRLFMMRYWFPVFPAFILGGFAAAWLLVGTAARWVPVLRARAGVLAGGAVLVLGALSLVAAAPSWGFSHNYRTVGTKPLSEFRNWLERQRDVGVLWSDGRTTRVLPLYAHTRFGRPIWSGQLQSLNRDGRQPASGEYVVLYGTRAKMPCYQCGDAARAVLGDPIRIPATWRQVFATEKGAVLVYRVR